MANIELTKLLSRSQFARHYGLSPATIDRLAVVDPVFPHPIRFSPRKAYWRRDEIEAWVEHRKKEPLGVGSIRAAAAKIRRSGDR